MERDDHSQRPLSVDLSDGSVQVDGKPVAVGSRGIVILQALVEADGAAVSKDDLLECVWPDCEVGEASLSVQIPALRKAMGLKQVAEQEMDPISPTV